MLVHMARPPRTDAEALHRRQVGERLTVAREALGQRAVDWVRRYKLKTASRLSQWESGKSYPAPLFLVQLCEDTGLTIDYFYRGKKAGVSASLADDLRSGEEALTVAGAGVPGLESVHGKGGRRSRDTPPG